MSMGATILVLMMKTSDPLHWEHSLYEAMIAICGVGMLWLLVIYMLNWTLMELSLLEYVISPIASAFRSKIPSKAEAMVPTPTSSGPRNSGKQGVPRPRVPVVNGSTHERQPVRSVQSANRSLSNADAMAPAPTPSGPWSSRHQGASRPEVSF